MLSNQEQIEARRQAARQKLAATRQRIAQNSPIRSVPTPQSRHFKPAVNGPPPVARNISPLPLQSLNIQPSRHLITKSNSAGTLRQNQVTGSISLISVDRFTVHLSGYFTPAIDVMRTFASKAYDPKSKEWNFDIKEYKNVLAKLQTLQPELRMEPMPLFLTRLLEKPPNENKVYDLDRIDNPLLEALMPFQVEGVCFGIEKNGRCLIGDDMGLGKTFQALGIASYYKENFPLLIVTTASMRNTWEETINKYITSIPVIQVQYMTSGRDFIDNAKVLIVSHDLMSRCLPKLKSLHFGVMIIDESHNLKNFKSKCTQAATELAKIAKRVVLLSGTPALSRPSELYAQLALIDDRFFGSFFDFSKRYCDGKSTAFGWNASGNSNLQELEILLSKRFMIRRTKADILKTLPNKTQEIVKLDVDLLMLSEEDRACLEALALKYHAVKKDKHAALLPFFAETAKIKAPSVCSYVIEVLQKNEKFLIFAHHQVMLNAIEQLIQSKNIAYIRIDGNTSCEQRKYFVDKFQYDDKYMCAILSITAANAGLTLTAARLVLFAELHWNPSILSQAESRAHRIGQEGHVIVQYLIAAGTCDDIIWPMLQEKQKTLNEAGLMQSEFRNVSVRKRQQQEQHQIALTPNKTRQIETYFTPKRQKMSAGEQQQQQPSSSKTNNNKCDPDIENCFDDDDDDVFNELEIDEIIKNSVANNKALQGSGVSNCFDDGDDDFFNTISTQEIIKNCITTTTTTNNCDNVIDKKLLSDIFDSDFMDSLDFR